MRAYLRLLRNRPFAALWAGSTVSLMGDALTWVALVWIVLDLTGSAADLGLLVIAYTAPVLLGGFVMGAALDRVDRRRLLIGVNGVLGCIVLSVPVASALGVLAVWQLYLVAAAYGLLKMANWAGVPAIMPSLVPEADLNTANALESVSFGLADVGGPGVAGALIAAFGAATVLVVDGASYAVFIAFLVCLRVPGPIPGSDAGGQAVAGRGLALKPALRFIRRTPPVLATTLMFMAFNVGEGMILVLVPIYARRGLHAGAGIYGLMLSTFAVAALIGSAVVGALVWRPRLGRSIAVSQILAGACVAGLAFPPSLPVALGALALAGLFASPLTIWAQTLRMRLIPAGMRGRVFGLLRTLMQSTPPIGGAVAGVLLSRGHLAATAVAAAAVMSVPGAIGLVSPALRTDGRAGDAGDAPEGEASLAYGSASA
jgi:MFS family permease